MSRCSDLHSAIPAAENGVCQSSLFMQIDPKLIPEMKLAWQSIVFPAPGPTASDTT